LLAEAKDEELEEPLAALASYWKVISVIGTSTEISAPSTLDVSVLEEPDPVLGPVLLSQVLLPETKTGEFWLALLPPSPNCPLES
jgi:hypothetical protein